MLNNDYIKYLLAKIIIGVLNMYLVFLYSNFFAPKVFGEFSLIIGLVNVSLALSIGWVSSAVSRYLDEYKERMNLFLGNVLLLWSMLTLVTLIVICRLMKLMTEIIQPIYIGFIIVIFIVLGFVVITEKVLLASRKSTVYSLLKVLQVSVNVGALLLIHQYVNEGIEGIFSAIILSAIVFSTGALVYLGFNPLRLRTNDLDWSFQKRLFRYGWPLMMLWGLSWILDFSDRYIIRFFYETSAVGLYDMNYRIGKSLIELFAVPLSMAVFPIMVSVWNTHGKERAEEMLGKSIHLYLVVIMPACAGLIAIRHLIFGSIVSEDYAMGQMVIVYVCIGIALSGLTQILYRVWKLEENTGLILKLTFITVGVNLLLNLIFIPSYGYVAAAVTTATAYAVACLLAYWLVCKSFHLVIDKRLLLKVMVSTLFMYGVVSWYSRTREGMLVLIGSVLLGGVSYMAMLYLTKGLKANLSIAKEVLIRETR